MSNDNKKQIGKIKKNKINDDNEINDDNGINDNNKITVSPINNDNNKIIDLVVIINNADEFEEMEDELYYNFLSL